MWQTVHYRHRPAKAPSAAQHRDTIPVLRLRGAVCHLPAPALSHTEAFRHQPAPGGTLLLSEVREDSVDKAESGISHDHPRAGYDGCVSRVRAAVCIGCTHGNARTQCPQGRISREPETPETGGCATLCLRRLWEALRQLQQPETAYASTYWRPVALPHLQ